jgi:hypothetical protein
MKIKFILLSLVLCSCASAPKKEPVIEIAPPPTEVSKPKNEAIKIDVEGLKRSLGLDRSRGDLGYQEKRFNTCSAGFGYPRENCSDQIFVSINFRLQCRDTTGTTSEVVTSAQMDPIAHKQVRWQIGKAQSVINTDDEGYAQINGVWTTAPKGQRLRLAVGSQFVYVRAGEVTRIVTPSNWCQ